jgi:hypothetical protein
VINKLRLLKHAGNVAREIASSADFRHDPAFPNFRVHIEIRDYEGKVYQSAFCPIVNFIPILHSENTDHVQEIRNAGSDNAKHGKKRSKGIRHKG